MMINGMSFQSGVAVQCSYLVIQGQFEETTQGQKDDATGQTNYAT